MSRPRLLVVTPRPPRLDGQGDQRRAHYAVAALSEEWDVEVLSWIPGGEKPSPGQWLARPGRLVRAAALAAARPVQVAYFQAWSGPSLARGRPAPDLTLFVTDRAVPLAPKRPFAVDFVDDLASAALTRAEVGGRWRDRALRPLWRWEARRVRELDTRLASEAVLGLAVSAKDAAAIGPSVSTIPNTIETSPLPRTGSKIVFTGNLFFAPNREAAEWICTTLAPRLDAAGVDPHEVVIAGRRPPRSMRAIAGRSGVDLRADVADVADVLAEAAVVLVPVTFGAGAQNKVLDAVGVGRPCVLTPFTNRAFGLEDGRSALVRERTVEDFADAILALRADPALGDRLAQEARARLSHCTRDAVFEAWRQAFRELMPSPAASSMSKTLPSSGPSGLPNGGEGR